MNELIRTTEDVKTIFDQYRKIAIFHDDVRFFLKPQEADYYFENSKIEVGHHGAYILIEPDSSIIVNQVGDNGLVEELTFSKAGYKDLRISGFRI